jgi:hypothetical protein
MAILNAILLFPSSLNAQSCATDSFTISTGNWPFTWDNPTAHDNDIAWDIEPIDDDNDGIKDNGFIIAGETNTAGTKKIQALVMRIDSLGSATPVWWKTFGGNKNDVAYSVKQTSDGNLIVCGSKTSKKFGTSNNSNVWLVKLDLNGDTIGTQHEYGSTGNEDGFAVIEDGEYYVVAGATGNKNHIDNDLSGDSINAGGDYWVLRIDTSDFTISWQKNFHGDNPGSNDTTYSDFARSIAITHAGNYIVGGFCESCEPNKQQQQAMLVKLNSSGSKIFKYDYGDESSDYQRDQGCHSIIETHEGSAYRYVGTGVAHPDTCFNAKSHDVYVPKTTTAGNDYWTPGCKLDEGKEFGGNKADEGYAVVQTCDGEYLIAGSVKSKANDVTCNNGGTGNFTSDAWLLKLDTAGAIQWDQSLGGIYNDEAHSIKKLWDGSYIMAGEFGTDLNGEHERQDAYVVRFEINECPVRLEQSANVKLTNTVIVYPNPSDGSLEISLRLSNNLNAMASINILNQVGKIVHNIKTVVEDGLVDKHLSFNDLPAGFYLIQVLVDRQAYEGKFVLHN